jgi:hypothetical protein
VRLDLDLIRVQINQNIETFYKALFRSMADMLTDGHADANVWPTIENNENKTGIHK